MIRYFVEPRPDEAFISIIARYQKDTLSNYRQVSHDLFGCDRVPINFFYSLRIGSFVSKVKDLGTLSFESIIHNHTMLPLYFNFYSQKKTDIILDDLRNNRTCTVLHGMKRKKREIKYCPICLVEDSKKFGEPYWHRAHNIPYMQICTKHNCYLESWYPPEDEHQNIFCASDVDMVGISPRYNKDDLILRTASKLISMLSTPKRIDSEEILFKALYLHSVEALPKERNQASLSFGKTFQIEAAKIDEALEAFIICNRNFFPKIVSGKHPILFALFDAVAEKFTTENTCPILPINGDESVIRVKRKLWENELRSSSFVSLRKSRDKLPRLARWLSKNDNYWYRSFNTLFYQKQLGRTKRLGRPPGKPSGRPSTFIKCPIYFLPTDLHYYQKLVEKKNLLLAKKTYRRITKTLFLSMPEFKFLRDRLKTFLRCRRFFNTQCETIIEFNLRKLSYVVDNNVNISNSMKKYYRKIGILSDID